MCLITIRQYKLIYIGKLEGKWCKSFVLLDNINCNFKNGHYFASQLQDLSNILYGVWQMRTLPVLHGAMECDEKGFLLVWKYQQLLSLLLAINHLPQVSRQSAKDNGNEVKPMTVHRSSVIYLWLRKAWKSSIWRPSEEGCVTNPCFKWGPLPPNDVSRNAQHFRKGEGRREGKYGGGWYTSGEFYTNVIKIGDNLNVCFYLQ
jgi:hypothetical protein